MGINFDDLIELADQLESLAKNVDQRGENTVDVVLQDIEIDVDSLMSFIAMRTVNYERVLRGEKTSVVISSVFIDAFLMGYFIAKKIEGKHDISEDNR